MKKDATQSAWHPQFQKTILDFDGIIFFHFIFYFVSTLA